MSTKRPAAFRPYRIAMLVLFFVLAGVPAILFLRSVIVTVSGSGPEVVGSGLDSSAPGGLASACVERAEQLRRQISDRFDGLRAMASRDGSAGLRRWRTYTVTFGDEVDAARESCRADPAAAERTAHLFDELDELARVANGVATGLLTDEGDTLARIERSFVAARKPREP